MIRNYCGHAPKIHPTAFVYDNAELIGKVTLEKDASVWPFCVLRGDIDDIIIGEGTNIQDNTVIHTNAGLPTVLGKNISVGHSVVMHGCKIMDNCIIGIGSIILDGVVIEEDCIIAAGSVVPPRTRIPKGSMVMGIPGKPVRPLRPDELEHIRWNAKEYLTLKEKHRSSQK